MIERVINLKTIKMKKSSSIKDMESMMKSIFCYGSLTKEDRYLQSYRKQLSPEEFNKVFDDYSKYLNDNFDVKGNVYTDRDGCTYNSLVQK